jgi:xanthine dehydrogenase accessory factor
MSELQAILDAYEKARARGERTALATVVSVEGSAYRRPGVRMLITESGETTGAISGGCLERDVLERAAQVIEAGGAARIVEYDTRGNEDIVWGLGLGCNGVVRVLLESLPEGSYGQRALLFIKDCLHERKRGVIATVIGKEEMAECESGQFIIGQRFIFDEHELSVNEQLLADDTADDPDLYINRDAQRALMEARSSVRSYGMNESRMEVFFDVIEPPRSLIIFGAEHDVAPLSRLAQTLGWHATVVDTRARSASIDRFSEADAVVLCRAADVAANIALTPDTAAVVMTHNYLDDVELLRALLPVHLSYLGILGPRQRTGKLLEELRSEGCNFTEKQLARLHNPIGIDIGAETPEEIALAIIAEIKAACSSRRGGFLRDRNAPIHDEPAINPASRELADESQSAQQTNAHSVESASGLACHLS